MATEEELGSLLVSIGLDGSGFQNGVSVINREMRVLTSEYKKAEAQIGEFGSATDKFKLQSEMLGQQIDLQKNKVAVLQVAYDRMVEAKGADSRATQELAIKLNRAQTELSGMENKLTATKNALVDAELNLGGVSDAVDSLNRQMRIAQTEFQATAAKIGAAGDEEELFKAKVDSLNEQMDIQRQKVETLQDAFERTANAKGRDAKATQNLQVELNQARAALSNLERDLHNTEDAWDNLANGAQQAGDEVDNAGGVMGRAGAFIQDTMRNAALAIGAAFVAAGAAVATAVAQMNMEIEKTFDRLQAATGSAREQAALLESAVLAAYSDGYGESIEQAATAVGLLEQQLNIAGDAADTALKNALAIQEVFANADIDGQARAVKSMTTAFADMSETDAFDVITVGFQNGVDKSGDFLDSLEEYSIKFNQLGLSAAEMTTMMKEGLDNGARNADIVADAVKEFQISATDGSKSTAEAFKVLGFNADEMRMRFIAGGEGARDSFYQVLDALQNVDTKTREDAALALFKTKWEDATERVVLSLSNVQNEIFTTEGATARAAETMHDNLATKFTQIGRQIKLAFVGDNEFGDALNNAADGILARMPEIQAAIKSALGAVGDAFRFVMDHADGLTAAFAGFTAAFTAAKIASGIAAMQAAGGAVAAMQKAWVALNATMLLNPWVLAIGAVVAAGVLIYKNWDTISAFLSETWQKIKENASAAWNGFKSFFSDLWSNVRTTATGAWQGIEDGIANAWGAIVQVLQSAWGSIVSTVRSAWDGVVGFFQGIWDRVVGVFQTVGSILGPVISNLWNAVYVTFQLAFETIRMVVQTGWANLVTIVTTVWETVKTYFATFWEVIRVIFATAFLVVYDLVTGRWGEIGTVFSAAGEKLRTILLDAWEQMKGIWSGAFDAIFDRTKFAWDFIGTLWRTGGAFVLQYLTNAWEELKRLWQAGLTAVGQFLENSIQAIKDTLNNGVEAMKSAWNGGIDAITGAWSAAWEFVKNAAVNGWNAVYNFFANAPDRISTYMSDLRKRISESWETLKTNAEQAGKDFLTGFVNGVMDMATWMRGKIEGFFNDVVGWAKDVLDIHSPSRVMQQIGRWTAEGFVVGIDDRKQAAIKSIGELGELTVDALTNHMAVLQSRLDSLSTVPLEQKLDNLVQQYATQNEIVYKLRGELDSLIATQGEFTDETAKAASKYAQESKRLRELGGEIESLNSTMAEAQKELAEEVQRYLDEMGKAQEEYQEKCETVRNAEAEGIRKLNEEYDRAYEARRSSLVNFVGLFDEVQTKDVNGSQLLNNLRGQVDTFVDWQKNLDGLKKRRIDTNLLAELTEMGPKSAAEIAALNGLSDAELQEYVRLWQQKNKLASQQATAELAGLKEDTKKKIDELKKVTASKLDELRSEWKTKNEKIRADTLAHFDKMKADAAQFGGDFISKITSSIDASLPMLEQKLAEIRSKIQSALSVAAPALGAIGGAVGGAVLSTIKVPGLATGGTITRAGLTLVGEQGPELLNLPRGSSVVPLDGSVGGVGGTTIEIHVNGTVYGVDDLQGLMTQAIRQTPLAPIIDNQSRQTVRKNY